MDADKLAELDRPPVKAEDCYAYECWDRASCVLVEGIGSVSPERDGVFVICHDALNRRCLVPIMVGDKVIILSKRTQAAQPPLELTS